MRDFEPYTAFKRIDRENTGFVDAESLTYFQRENGFRELEPEDFKQMIRYFDLDGDKRLNYHDFLQILLPCDDAYLRAAASQRPNNELPRHEYLPMRVERALSQLIFKEVRLQLKADQMKRTSENAYDFSFPKAFKAIDDWSYGYIDQSNLKRFLRSMGYLATKQELIAILRRFDMDGDAKINLAEFEVGMKSSLTAYAAPAKGKRPKSALSLAKGRAQKRTLSRDMSTVTPKKLGSSRGLQRSSSGEFRSGRKLQSNGSASTNRKKAMQQMQAAFAQCGANSAQVQNRGYHDSGAISPNRLNKSVCFSK
jgi:Ca2+-binding EF-hand superfamily protein